jgi:putative transposase
MGVIHMSQPGTGGALQPEEMVAKLCQVDILAAQGLTVMEALKAIGMRLETYRRWRHEIKSLMRDETARLKLLEAENVELRRVLADLTVRTTLLRAAVQQTEPRTSGPMNSSTPPPRHAPIDPGAIASQE